MLQWQPITGCSYASPGCANCKTISLSGDALRREYAEHGLVDTASGKAVWTGKIRLAEERLSEPRSVPAKSVVLVCPHGDLFHEDCKLEWRDRIFDVIDECTDVAFQFATKRARFAAPYLRFRYPHGVPKRIAIGIAAERQQELDARAAWFGNVQGTKFLSLYPMLGAINIGRIVRSQRIAAVHAGDEPERPAPTQWIADLREECSAHCIPFTYSRVLVGAE